MSQPDLNLNHDGADDVPCAGYDQRDQFGLVPVSLGK